MADRMPEPPFDATLGRRAAEAEGELPTARGQERVERGLELGLPAAPCVGDRSISTFVRGELPHFAGINTLLKLPYLEDARKVGEHDVAFLGVPFDLGTTYRPGCRFGPQGIRRISSLYTTYFYELGVDLLESVSMVDLGDVFVIPANLEKSFDQVSRAVSHVFASGCFPFLMGGDHSLGYPNVRGIAPHIDGNLGIVHIAEMGGDTKAYPINGTGLTAREVLSDFYRGEDLDELLTVKRFNLVKRGRTLTMDNIDQPLEHGETITVYSQAVATGGVKGACVA